MDYRPGRKISQFVVFKVQYFNVEIDRIHSFLMLTVIEWMLAFPWTHSASKYFHCVIFVISFWCQILPPEWKPSCFSFDSGVNLWDQRGAYEVARASLLSKDPGIPGQSFPAKVSCLYSFVLPPFFSFFPFLPPSPYLSFICLFTLSLEMAKVSKLCWPNRHTVHVLSLPIFSANSAPLKWESCSYRRENESGSGGAALTRERLSNVSIYEMNLRIW